MASRVIFLDRDGTVNVDHGYVYRSADWQFTDRAVEGLRILRDCGFRLAIVTNQSGIARGYYRLHDVDVLHAHFQSLLSQAGFGLDAIALCPHDEAAGCDCRKPLTGMARQVEQQIGDQIDFGRSWTIGDKLSDLNFGFTLGTRTALIRGRYWHTEELTRAPELVVDSLYVAAQEIAAWPAD